jgi:hypothetical protein
MSDEVEMILNATEADLSGSPMWIIGAARTIAIRNKLLERVLEETEKVWPYLAGHGFDYDGPLYKAIRAARGGDET